MATIYHQPLNLLPSPSEPWDYSTQIWATITSKSELLPRPRYALIAFFKSHAQHHHPDPPNQTRGAPYDTRKTPEAQPRPSPAWSNGAKNPGRANQIQARACSARAHASKPKNLGQDGAITEGNRHGRTTPAQRGRGTRHQTATTSS